MTTHRRIDSAIDRRCAQRAEDVFKRLIESAPASFTGPVHLIADDVTALAGRPEGGRACACAEVRDHASRPEGYVYVTWRFLTRFTENQQEGVLRHELAHVALLMAGDAGHSERDADKKAKDLWGKTIKYVSFGEMRDVQTIGVGTSPRPARLDEVDGRSENPSVSECVARPNSSKAVAEMLRNSPDDMCATCEAKWVEETREERGDLLENPAVIPNPGAWDLKRIHALFGYTDGQKIPKDAQDERYYRGVRVRLLKSKATGQECARCGGSGQHGLHPCRACNSTGHISDNRGGKGHRIVVDCGCGQTVGFGRMVQHAGGRPGRGDRCRNCAGVGCEKCGMTGVRVSGCDYARATFFAPKDVCNCATCVKEQRELDRSECPNTCRFCGRHGAVKLSPGKSTGHWLDDRGSVTCSSTGSEGTHEPRVWYSDFIAAHPSAYEPKENPRTDGSETSGEAMERLYAQHRRPTPAPGSFNVYEWANAYAREHGLKTFDVSPTYESHGDSFSRPVWKLHWLIVPKDARRSGKGTAAVEALCAKADAHGVVIVLNLSDPDGKAGTTSRARLVRFYKRFGFVENKGRKADHAISEEMIRVPR